MDEAEQKVFKGKTEAERQKLVDDLSAATTTEAKQAVIDAMEKTGVTAASSSVDAATDTKETTTTTTTSTVEADLGNGKETVTLKKGTDGTYTISALGRADIPVTLAADGKS